MKIVDEKKAIMEEWEKMNTTQIDGDTYKKPTKETMDWLSTALDRIAQKAREAQIEIDDRMRQAQAEYCKHERFRICSFYCPDCHATWTDRKFILAHPDTGKEEV